MGQRFILINNPIQTIRIIMFKTIKVISSVLLMSLTGCADVEKEDDDHHDHNHGLPTTAILTFTDAGGAESSFTWVRIDEHDEAVVDTVVLAVEDGPYTLSVEIWNEAEDPAEDITPEILQYDDEHQFFFTGDAVVGPATGDNADALIDHAYADEDANGLPLGLDNTADAIAAGEGSMDVMLRHLPPENGQAVKVEGMAATVAEEGFSGIGGDIDIDVTFPVLVE